MAFNTNTYTNFNKCKSILKNNGYRDDVINNEIVILNEYGSTPGVYVKKLGLVLASNRNDIFTYDEYIKGAYHRKKCPEMNIIKFIELININYPPLSPLFVNCR